MDLTLPFNLSDWIDANRESLKPPVCNRELFVGSEFIVMVVGGPNSRKDYHYDAGPELFHQIEGEMLLRTIQDGKPVDITIREGDIFMLPPGVPHSPQRFADTVGSWSSGSANPASSTGLCGSANSAATSCTKNSCN